MRTNILQLQLPLGEEIGTCCARTVVDVVLGSDTFTRHGKTVHKVGVDGSAESI